MPQRSVHLSKAGWDTYPVCVRGEILVLAVRRAPTPVSACPWPKMVPSLMQEPDLPQQRKVGTVRYLGTLFTCCIFTPKISYALAGKEERAEKGYCTVRRTKRGVGLLEKRTAAAHLTSPQQSPPSAHRATLLTRNKAVTLPIYPHPPWKKTA